MNPPVIYGIATLNEKSQLVVPIKARKALGIGPGSEIVIMGSPMTNSLILTRIEDVQARMKGFTAAIEGAKKERAEHYDGSTDSS